MPSSLPSSPRALLTGLDLRSRPGCDNATVLALVRNCAVAFGPGRIRQAHTRDEFITRQELAARTASCGRLLAEN